MGAVATTPIACTFTGDASLCRRPMGRVLEPLSRFGTESMGRAGGRLPLTLRGAANPMPVVYASPVASAQVKSAILLAGLNAPGRTTVIEPGGDARPYRADAARPSAPGSMCEPHEDGTAVTVTGEAELSATAIAVPGDPSSAAFPLVAAPDRSGQRRDRARRAAQSDLRMGLFETLREMGASLDILDARDAGGEPVASLRARFSALKGD